MNRWLAVLLECAALLTGCGGEEPPAGGACVSSLDCGGSPCIDGQCQMALLMDAGPRCQPTSCVELGFECGPAPDQCGDTLDCDPCTEGADCVAGICQVVCTPTTCEEQGASCGPIQDGCGATLDCGGCGEELCGAANQCGEEPCIPVTCEELGATCGMVDDGCGATLDCGSCAAPESCGGAGVDNACGCTPVGCTEVMSACGAMPDGCGGTVDCGPCASGRCGVVTANRCGMCRRVEMSTSWRSPRVSVSGTLFQGAAGWSMATLARSRGGGAAVARVDAQSGATTTQRLLLRDFRFTLPPNARVRGTQIRIRHHASVPNQARDLAVRLALPNRFSDLNLARRGERWPAEDEDQVYGVETTNWGFGPELNRQAVQSTSFGVLLRAELFPVQQFFWANVFVDHVQVRVHYTTEVCE